MLDRRLGFAQLNDGKAASGIVPHACFSCHEAVKALTLSSPVTTITVDWGFVMRALSSIF